MHFTCATKYVAATLALCILGVHTPAAAQSTTIPVDPKATYLRLGFDPLAQPAQAIDLAAIGIQPGDPVLLERLGFFSYDSGVNFAGSMVAVFSSSSVLDGPSGSHRVPGAIDAGPDLTTMASYSDGQPTDIAEDFVIASPGYPGYVQLTVPAGAQYLFVTPNDSYFGDNIGFGYAVRITLLDTDRDGVLDDVDDCVPSDMRPQVDTGSGPTSVANVVDESGCTIQDYVNSYQVAAKNHGAYVSAIAALANRLRAAGLISQSQHGELVSGAARSSIGK